MRVLVVGGDGQVGSALVPVLRSAGHEVTTTSHRTPLPNGAHYLELVHPDPATAEGVDAVVLCAALTERSACEADPDRAQMINVTAPLTLAQPVLSRGGQVIFLSTSIVLGGDQPYLPIDAPYAPCDAYSRMKAEAEQRLLALSGAEERLAILRLVKVMDAEHGIIADWATAMNEGEPITPYVDLATAPITTNHVTAKISELLAPGSAGIHHLSGIEHSYADVAVALSEVMGWPKKMVRPVRGREINAIAASSPAHSSLAADPLVPLEVLIRLLARQLARRDQSA